MFILYLFVFILGAVVGSFLNVVAMRLPEDEDFVSTPSHCDSCKTQLKYYDMIPLISYMIYRGKCRYCGAKYSPQHFIVELISGILTVGIFYISGFSLFFIIYFIISSFLIVIAIIDWNTYYIPDIMVIGVGIFGLILNIWKYFYLNRYFQVAPMLIAKDAFFGFAVGAGIFFLIYLLSRGGMGEGDIYLTAVLGIVLGFRNTLMLMFFSFITGALLSVILLLLKIKSRKDMIPFGPFIVLSFYIVLFFGDPIYNFYVTNFLT